VPYIPVRAKIVLPDLVENLCSLIASQYATYRPRHLWTWKACEGIAGMLQSTSTDGSLTVLHRPDAGKKLGSLHRPSADRTKQEAKTLINLCGGSQNGRFVNLHNSLKLQNSQKNTKNE